jgi:hypothetical protein
MAAFMGGVLGGVGFGVVESLLNLSTRQDTWWPLIVARTGTLIMHALTTGLVGWGWGQLVATRRPWRLLLAYLSAVVIHGLWNAGAIGLALLGQDFSQAPTFSAETLAQTSGMLLSLFCLTSLGLMGLIMLAGLGHRLRRNEA